MERVLRSEAPLTRTQEDYWLELKSCWTYMNEALADFEKDRQATLLAAARLIFDGVDEE